MDALRKFGYLGEVAKKYGTFYLAQDFETFVQGITAQQLTELAQAYEEIHRRHDAYRLSRWIDRCKFEERKPDFHQLRFAQRMGQLFLLFDQLEAANVQPFSSGKVHYIEKFGKPVWRNVPTELHYLIVVAEKYAGSLSEVDMLDWLDRVSDEDMEILARTADRVRLNRHYPVVLEWLKHFPLDKHEEAKRIYSLFGVFDHAGLKFE